MASNRKPRKQYRPKPVYADSARWAMSGACVLTKGQQTDLMEPVKEALKKLVAGTLKRDDWNTLANALNLAETLAKMEIGSNLLPEIEAGQAALHRIGQRLANGSGMLYRDKELSVMVEAINLFRIQLTFCSQAELSKAVKRVEQLITSGACRRVVETFNAISNREAR